MTRAGAAGRASRRDARTHAILGPAIALLGCLVMLAVIAASCGPTTPTIPTLAPVSPGASSPAASPGGSSAAGARPTPWPANSVLGMEALGIADGEIGAAVTDLNLGVANEDLALMRRAADGLANIDDLLPNMEKIRINQAMVPFAESYETAITSIDDAATRLRDAIDAGDAPAIGTATEDLFAGLAKYTALQPELANWIRQIPDQKRLLVS